MSDPYASIEKGIAGVEKSVVGVGKGVTGIAKSVDALTRSFGKSSRTMRVSGLLDEQVDELSALIASDDQTAYAAARVAESDEIRGMYAEMQALSLVTLLYADGGVLYSMRVTPLGHWAVRRHELERSLAASAEKRANRHDFRMAVIGGLFGLAGVVLGFALGHFIH